MIIASSSEKFEIGQKVNTKIHNATMTDHSGIEHDNVSFLVIREATVEEYIEYSIENCSEYTDRHQLELIIRFRKLERNDIEYYYGILMD